MRVKNTQEQKQIHNVFLKSMYLLASFIKSIGYSLYYFVWWKNLQNKKRPAIYELFDFLFLQWPKAFISHPSGYKITKIFGDFIHHIFLKK